MSCHSHFNIACGSMLIHAGPRYIHISASTASAVPLTLRSGALAASRQHGWLLFGPPPPRRHSIITLEDITAFLMKNFDWGQLNIPELCGAQNNILVHTHRRASAFPPIEPPPAPTPDWGLRDVRWCEVFQTSKRPPPARVVAVVPIDDREISDQ